MNPSPLALDIATALANDGRLYWTSSASANPDAVVAAAGMIDTILLPRLAAHADAIEDALDHSVDSTTYPDGPNLARDTRAALRASLNDLRP